MELLNWHENFTMQEKFTKPTNRFHAKYNVALMSNWLQSFQLGFHFVFSCTQYSLDVTEIILFVYLDRNMLLENNSRITVMEGAKNNLPDADAQKSAECIRELASGLTEKDLLLVLISGPLTYFLHIESVFL